MKGPKETHSRLGQSYRRSTALPSMLKNFPVLSEAFANCKPNKTKKDPELRFNDLDHFNMKIARINKKYEKDDR